MWRSGVMRDVPVKSGVLTGLPVEGEGKGSPSSRVAAVPLPTLLTNHTHGPRHGPVRKGHLGRAQREILVKLLTRATQTVR